MVCKKCGKSFSNDKNTCPFCGVGQENRISIKRLEKDLQKLKIEDTPSSFCGDANTFNKQTFDIEDIIYDLEELKVKEKDNSKVPRVEPVSDEELFELIEDIKENKELFIADKSQYINKTSENTDTNTYNIGINDLLKKQKIYNPEEPRINSIKEIRLPKSLGIQNKDTRKKINYKISAIIGIFIFIVVGLLAITFTRKIIVSPKTKLLNNLSESYNEIITVFDKYTENILPIFENDSISINSTSNINTTENQNTTNEIVNIKYIEDKKEKIQYYEYANLNKIKSEFKKIFIMNNKLYISKENKTDEFFITNSNFISLLDNDITKNSESLFNVFVESIKSNIKNDDIIIKNVKEGNKRLSEYIINVDEKLYNNIYHTFLTSIKKDNKILDMLVDKLNYSYVELLSELKWKLNELETKSSNKNILTYSFVTEDNKIIKHHLKYNDFDITISIDDNKLELIVKELDNEKLYLKTKQIDENLDRYNFTLNYENYELTGDFYQEKDKLVLNYQKNNQNNINKTEIVNFELTKGKKQDNKYINNITINYQTTNNNTVISKNIKSSNVIEVNSKIPKIDITNPDKIDFMDDNLKNKIKKYFPIFIK